MAQVRIGQYELLLESRGIRFHRTGGGGRVPVRPLLTFNVSTPSGQPVWFQLQRLVAASPEVIEFHGFTTQDVSLDGRVTATREGSRLNVELSVQNATAEMQLRVGAYLILTGEADPRWLVPGFFYGDNKPRGCTRIYPSFSEINRDLRRLSSSYWAVRSDRAAMPLVCSWTYGAFTWLSTEGVFGRARETPRGVGMSGLYFGSDDGQPTLGVEYPYREAPAKFSFCHEDKTEPEETFVFLPEATPLRLGLSLGLDLPELHAYDDIVRMLYNERSKLHPTKPKVPQETAERAAHMGLLRWHYDGRHAAIFETATFDRHFGRKGNYLERTHMHAGWLSGGLPAYALLLAGRESNHAESLAAGTAVFNKLTSQLSPAGTIFPVWTEDHGWSCSFGPEEGTAHSRTVGEAVLYILRAMSLEMRHGVAHGQWYEAAISSLNYAMGSQREDGAFPSYYDLTTGRPTSYEGCGGFAWMAAMAAGAALFHKSHFRDVARRAGEYYATFVRNEILFGTVEDQPLVPTCDDCHWALIAFMLLYDIDRDERWLQMACRAADLALTWRLAYNINFPHESILSRYDFRSRGGDISSVAAPTLGVTGLMSHSELLKLAALTGDDYYRQRADDARQFMTQLVACEDSDLNARAGMVATQVFHTDWWQPKGTILSISGAMPAALVKYCELVQRALKIPAQVIEAAREEALEPKARRLEVVMYADVALADEDFSSHSSRDEVASGSSEFGSLTAGLANALGIGGGAPRRRPATNFDENIEAPGRSEIPGDMPRLTREVPRSLTGTMSSLLGLPERGDGAGGDAPIPRPSSARQPTPLPRTRTSGDNIAQPPLVGPTPLPISEGSYSRSTGPAPDASPASDDDMPAAPPTPREPGASSDEVEIKYKIF